MAECEKSVGSKLIDPDFDDADYGIKELTDCILFAQGVIYTKLAATPPRVI